MNSRHYQNEVVFFIPSTFPKTTSGTFWFINLFKKTTVKESVPHAEERRLFYVALTRTKNYVYLLVNEKNILRSPFVNELSNIIKENTNILKIES